MNGANGSDATASGSNQANNQSSPVTVASLDADFLPLIYEIVRSIEKESHEGQSGLKNASAGQIGSSGGGVIEYHLKVQELKDKLDKFRQQVNSIKGIDMSKDHQIDKVRIYKDQLDHKRKLLAKYKNNCPIEGVPKV